MYHLPDIFILTRPTPDYNISLPWKLFPDHETCGWVTPVLSLYVFCHGTYLMAYLSVGLLS